MRTKLFDGVTDRVLIEVEKDGKTRTIELAGAKLNLEVDHEVAERQAEDLWRVFEPTGRITVGLTAYGRRLPETP